MAWHSHFNSIVSKFNDYTKLCNSKSTFTLFNIKCHHIYAIYGWHKKENTLISIVVHGKKQKMDWDE